MKERTAEEGSMRYLACNTAWWRETSTAFAAMVICTASVTIARSRSHEHI